MGEAKALEASQKAEQALQSAKTQDDIAVVEAELEMLAAVGISGVVGVVLVKTIS